MFEQCRAVLQSKHEKLIEAIYDDQVRPIDLLSFRVSRRQGDELASESVVHQSPLKTIPEENEEDAKSNVSEQENILDDNSVSDAASEDEAGRC